MARHRLVVLLLDQALPLDFAIPLHVFGREAPAFYQVSTATVDGNPIEAAGGLRLVPDGDLNLLRRAQTILIPGYGDAATTRLDQMTIGLLRSAAKRGARMVSICSGAFALAQAGLLDGSTVTTHWSLAGELARQYPQTTVDARLLFADNGKVLTSGGVTAGVDLALHILRQDLGATVANHVARRIVMAPRGIDEQVRFIEAPPVPPGDDAISAAQQWMLSSLARPITTAEMAEIAHMSRRNFHRRFVEKAGLTPLAWLRDQRINYAKELLETTDLPVEDIAGRVGMGTPANLRSQFRRATSMAPAEHRRLFSSQPTRQSWTVDPITTVRPAGRLK